MSPINAQELDKAHALPPKAAKKPHALEIHGHQRVDEYYWLRERENPEVIQWLEDENTYRLAVMARTEPLQKALADELRDRIKQDDQSAAYPERGYSWYSRTEDGKQYEVHFRCKMEEEASDRCGEEELVLDENELAQGHEYCSVGSLEVSPSGQIVAWPVDFVGRRLYTIQFRDMSTGQMMREEIPETTGNLVFAEDNLHVFYTRQDPETLRSDRVYCHRLGADPTTDRLVYNEQDEQFSVHVSPTKSRRYIQIVSAQTLSTEYRLVDAMKPELPPVVFHPRERDHEYHIDHLENRFVIRTNWNAPNFRLMETTDRLDGNRPDDNGTDGNGAEGNRPTSGADGSVGGPTFGAVGRNWDKSNWRELIAHDTDIFVEGFELLNDWLVLEERSGGLTRIRYRRWDEDELSSLDFGEPCYAAGLAATSIADTPVLRYSFSSPKTPPSIIDVDLRDASKTVVKQTEVLGGFDSRNYHTQRIWAKARDGVEVPVTVLRHRDTPVDGTAPCLVYAYGSYGISMDDGFSPLIFNLVNRGFVYAVAHIRGGQEMGRQWYEDGKLLKKKNTFTDFIDCTRYLIDQQYADPERVYARGGSAGGLLMGAVANMAPELYHGMIADVPFVDVVTTMLDESIPLTTSEYDEWGNPNDPDYYRYMLSYSPYDNVQSKAYPNLLVTTGLHDSQVQYWEPAKWVARLREQKTDDNLLLLYTEMHAGHGGVSGRYDRYREIALRQAFLLMLAEIDQ